MYNNEFFEGKAYSFPIQSLDFHWGCGAPLPHINPYNFSVRIKGFISVEVTGRYKFMLESDGVSLFRFMKRPQIIKDQVGIDLESGVSKFKKSVQTQNYLHLNAQTLYDIEIEYIRSIHFDYDLTCDSHLRLTWAHSASSRDEAISEFELDMDAGFGIEGYTLDINALF